MGFRGKFKNKRDTNEPEIFDALRKSGLSVEATDKPTDAVVGYGGRTYLVEVKNGPKARLTKAQADFMGSWTGHAAVLASVDEALAFAKRVKEDDE